MNNLALLLQAQGLQILNYSSVASSLDDVKRRCSNERRCTAVQHECGGCDVQDLARRPVRRAAELPLVCSEMQQKIW